MHLISHHGDRYKLLCTHHIQVTSHKKLGDSDGQQDLAQLIASQ